MRITTLTAVHIGSGEILSLDCFRGSEGELLRLDLPAILGERYGADPGRAADLANELETPEGLGKFVRELQLDIVERHHLYRLAASGTIVAHIQDPTFGEKAGSLEIHECVKSRFRGFLPGSSVKGALLTAVFFSKYRTFGDAQKALGRGANPEKDTLSRRLRLSDTFGEARLAMYLCRRIMRQRRGDTDSPLRPLELWAECVAAGQELHAGLPTIASTAAGKPPKGRPLTGEDVKGLCQAGNKFSSAIVEDDLRHMEKYGVPTKAADGILQAIEELNGSETSCMLRVGWGVGRAATSVKLLEGDDYQPSKTRWLVANPVGEGAASDFSGDLAIPLGWVRVEFEESDYVS